ncbi:MAG: hypothetical protein R3286_08580 [Gammaproteobacteria bacterium]|nr:hypothetical protein [Gammaproteobacteria bacterium]
MHAITRFVCASTLALAAAAVGAVGLGNIQVSSALNEPLAASIPVIGVTPEELVNMSVRLAEPKTFEDAGIARPYVLTKLRFEVKDDGNGKGHIAVTSRERIKEPSLEFIIDVEWGKGRLRRTYVVLMEPR